MGGIVSSINPFGKKSGAASPGKGSKNKNDGSVDGNIDDTRLLGATNDDNNSVYTGTLNNSDSRLTFTGVPFRGRHVYVNVINIRHPEEHKWLQSHTQYIVGMLQSNEMRAFNNPTNVSHEKVMFLCAEFRFKQISHFAQVIINEPDVIIDNNKKNRKISRRTDFDRYDIDRWSNTDSTVSLDSDPYIQLVNGSNVYVFVNMHTGDISWTFPNNIPISYLKFICHMDNEVRTYFNLTKGVALNSLPVEALEPHVIEACQRAEKLNNELLGNYIRQPYNENISDDHATWLENSLLGDHKFDDDPLNEETLVQHDDNNTVISNTTSFDTIAHTEIKDLKYYVSGLDNSDPYLVVHSIDASVNRLRTLDLNRYLRWATHTLLCLNISNNLLTSLEGIEACQNLKILDASCNLIESIGALKGCKYLQRLQLAGNRIKTLTFINNRVVLDKHEMVTADDTQASMSNTIITSSDESNPNDANSNPNDASNNPNDASNNIDEANVNPNEANNGPNENTKDKKDNLSEHNTDDDTLMQLTYLDIQDNPVNSLEGFRAINKDLQYLDVRNCELDDQALQELIGLPLETLNADNNKISNLPKALELLRTLKSLHHLAFIGNPIAKSSADTDADADVSSQNDRDDNNNKKKTEDKEVKKPKNNNGSFYIISILDAAGNLKSLDHLSIAPSMYRNLELMKSQLEAKAFVQEVTSFYAHEMASLAGIQRNLLQRHQFEQFTLEKAVKSRTLLLQEEMNDFISYSETKITKGLAQIQIALLSSDATDNNTNENINNTPHVNDSLERLQKNVFESQSYLNDLKEQFAALKRRKKRENDNKI